MSQQSNIPWRNWPQAVSDMIDDGDSNVDIAKEIKGVGNGYIEKLREHKAKGGTADTFIPPDGYAK